MQTLYLRPEDYALAQQKIQILKQPTKIIIPDVHGGFGIDLHNDFLDTLNKQQLAHQVVLEINIDQRLKHRYPNINLCFSIDSQIELLEQCKSFRSYCDIDFKNFVCSFAGSEHVGRKLLLGVLHQRKWFDPDFSTKNLSFDCETLYGHLKDFFPEQVDFYSKFFCDFTTDFYTNTWSINYQRLNHMSNMEVLEPRLTKSFLHIVSETMPTSYYPYTTEKFLLSVVSRGLFLAYAQPLWHEFLSKYYGFKLYTKLFDYRFDSILNPVDRILELTAMISKFSSLKPQDWHDLYRMEQDTIEYNYDHYFSGNYIKHLYSHE